VIQQERRRWRPFRRVLSKEDQAACDRLFACAERQLQAEGQIGRPWPFETMGIAVLMEHEKRVEKILKIPEELLAGRE
jgi:hypothetical protein